MSALLDVKNLSLQFRDLKALRNVSFHVSRGEVVGVVGESGSGKSTLISSIIGLLGNNGRITSGEIEFQGKNTLAMDEHERRALRGREIAMVFQDPMTSLNPVFSIGAQLVDFQHQVPSISLAEKRTRARDMLKRVGIADPEGALKRFPHELSGGMRQRVAIAAALLMKPQLLLADEPTTALDVTMEAQIIHLLRELRGEIDGGIVIVTHHLGVIAELCDRVYVMYAGEVVEEALVDDLFHRPQHPYTKALIACDPAQFADGLTDLPVIPGRVPDLTQSRLGCSFAARCSIAKEHCFKVPPPLRVISQTQAALCHEVKA